MTGRQKEIILKEKIYIFSGLGADKRVFKHIKFIDFEPVFIDWISPEDNETLENYSKRISLQIKHENPIIVGISFGGIVAIEIDKQIKTKKLILLATAKTRNELPKLYLTLGKLSALKIIPTQLLKKTNFITHYFFGTKTKEDRKTLKEIIDDTDPKFLKWALHKILNWTNTDVPSNFIHIHGTNDKIIPLKTKMSAIEIKNGGHFMTLNKFEELNQILNAELEKIKTEYR